MVRYTSDVINGLAPEAAAAFPGGFAYTYAAQAH